MSTSKRPLQGPMSGGGSVAARPLRAPPVGTGGKPRPACAGCGKEMLLEYRPGLGTRHRCEDCPTPGEAMPRTRAPSSVTAGAGSGYIIGSYVPGQARVGAATWALTDIDLRNPAFASLLPDGHTVVGWLMQGNLSRAVYNDLQSAQMAVRIADRIYHSHAPWMVVPLSAPATVSAPAVAQSGTPAPLSANGYCIMFLGGEYITPATVAGAFGLNLPKGALPPPGAPPHQREVAVYRKIGNANAVAAKARAIFPASRPFLVVPYIPPQAAAATTHAYP